MRIWDQLGRTKTDKVFLEGLNLTTGSTNQDDAAQAMMNASPPLSALPDQTIMFNEFDHGLHGHHRADRAHVGDCRVGPRSDRTRQRPSGLGRSGGRCFPASDLAVHHPPPGGLVHVRAGEHDADLLAGQRRAQAQQARQAAAPAPSTSVWVVRSSRRIASAISASVTVMNPARPARSASNVNS